MSEAGTQAAAGTGDAAAQAAAATAAAAANKPWYDGADSETIGHIQNRGLDKMTPAAAALNEIKAYREAQKLLGVPPDQILRMPKDANDAEGIAKINEKLGVITDPAKFDFSGIKFTDGSELSPEFTKSLSAALAKAGGVTGTVAKEIAQFVVQQIDSDEAGESAEYTQKLAAEKDTLSKNWGSNANVNKVVAQNAAAKLGVDAEALSALEKTVGYAKVMEMFRNIGVRMGEDKFVNGGVQGGVMTKEQAEATLAERMADHVWSEKFNKGDSAAKQEWQNLTRVIAGV